MTVTSATVDLISRSPDPLQSKRCAILRADDPSNTLNGSKSPANLSMTSLIIRGVLFDTENKDEKENGEIEKRDPSNI